MHKMRPQPYQRSATSNKGTPEYPLNRTDEASLVCIEWLRRHAEQEVLIERWQKLDSEVCRLPGWRNLSDEQRSELPQSSAMKELDKEIDTLFRLNENLISSVIETGASTTAGFLYKLRVAASLVPRDENENAHTLLQGILRDAETLWGPINALPSKP